MDNLKIYKRVLILPALFLAGFCLLSISFLPFIPEAAAQVNLARPANGGRAILVPDPNNPFTIGEGIIENTNDGNLGTNYRATRINSRCCDGEMKINCEAYFIEDIILAGSATVDRIAFDVDFLPLALPDFPFANEGLISRVDVYIYRSGAWTQIVNGATGDRVVNGPWLNVERVRIRVSRTTWYSCTGMCGYGCLLIPRYGPIAILNEIEVWGILSGGGYQDIGLRIQTPSGIVSIAGELGAPTSPLRISKGGVIYGVALVNPGDPNDSGVRIETNTGLKALRKF